ncbi:phage portal protein [Nesterenkonia populi]|uniref:phage portal protein n=1 Tax=Nesterenkonia populi TaxID=1591087 RepID=UPI0011BF0D14|nr:phage portal protein [Nesterenkonia populi]
MLEAREADAKVKNLYDALTKRRPQLDELDAYYEGRHPLRFASQEWREYNGERYKGFADNWCAVVVDALNERLKVNGLRTDGSEHLWDDWLRNEMEAQSSQGFLQTIAATRSAVIVWRNGDGDPVAQWEPPQNVYVEYDPVDMRTRRFALKTWMDDTKEFAYLYDDQAVYKFSRPAHFAANRGSQSGLIVPGTSTAASDGWDPEQGNDDSWPLRHPMRAVPVVEVKNRPRLRHDPISDIAGTRSMQDAINLLWAYLFAAADHASFQARVVMGQEHPKTPVLDGNGQKIGEKPVDLKELRQGRILWLTGQNAKIGQWDAARLDVFTDVIDININHIAAQTRTPAHYFVANKGMSNLNGETLKATETPLVKKADEFQMYASGDVAEIFRLFARVRGEHELARQISGHHAVWADKEIRSEAQRSDALLKKKQMGYPLRYLLEEDGHSPHEVERIMQMREEEQISDPLVAATNAMRQGLPDEPAAGS